MDLPYLWKLNALGNIQIWRIWLERCLEHKERFTIKAKGDVRKTKGSPVDRAEGGSQDNEAVCMSAWKKAVRKWKDKKEKKSYIPIDDPTMVKLLEEGDYQRLRDLLFSSVGIRDKEDAKERKGSFRKASEYGSKEEYLEDPFTCMLSMESEKLPDFPVVAQCKCDGIRMISTELKGKVVITTRQKKQIKSVPHIKQELKVLFQVIRSKFGDVEGFLDGEGIGLDKERGSMLKRQSVQSRISRSTNIHPDHQSIFYVVFDYAVPNVRQYDRIQMLVDVFSDPQVESLSHILLCNTEIIMNNQDLAEYHKNNTSGGYEGTIVRNMNGFYEQKRSKNSVKMKDFFTEEAIIVGAEAAKGQAEGCCVWLLKSAEPPVVHYKAVHHANFQKRKKYYDEKEKYIGRMVMVKFYSKSSDGVPNHAIVEGFRDEIL